MGGCRAAVTYADLQAFQNAPRQRREPNKREARRIASLQARCSNWIDAELDEACDAEDEDKAERWKSEGDHRGRAVAGAGGWLAGLRPTVRAAAGAIVTIDRNGEAVIHRGLLREAEAKALRTLERCGKVSAAKAKPGTTTKARTTSSPRPRACPTGWRSG
jgi:ParB family chromosome partitioning protein